MDKEIQQQHRTGYRSIKNIRMQVLYVTNVVLLAPHYANVA